MYVVDFPGADTGSVDDDFPPVCCLRELCYSGMGPYNHV